MAVKAEYRNYDRHVTIDLYVDDRILRVSDDPMVPGYDVNPDIDFYWDDDKLESGERVFVGIEIRDIRSLDDEDLRAIKTLNLPLVNIPELQRKNADIAAILRRARDEALALA